MGFDHIYLVGYDYTHIPSRSLHWYEKGRGVFFSHENYNKDFFEIAKELEKRQIKFAYNDGAENMVSGKYKGMEDYYNEKYEKWLKD